MSAKASRAREIWKTRITKLGERLNEALQTGWFEMSARTCNPERCAMKTVDGCLVILIGNYESVSQVGARLGFDPISETKPE
jgi:hypothetical protein